MSSAKKQTFFIIILFYFIKALRYPLPDALPLGQNP